MEWLSRLASDQLNFVAAIRFAFEEDPVSLTGVQLTVLLGEFWIRRAEYWSEARTLFAEALVLLSDQTTSIRADVLCCLGKLAWLMANYEAARSYFGECLPLATSHHRIDLLIQCHSFLGPLAQIDGRTDDAQTHCLTAVNLASNANDQGLMAMALHFDTFLLFQRGDLVKAAHQAKQVLTMLRDQSDTWFVTHVLVAVGMIEARQLGIEAGLPWFRECYGMCRDTADERGIFWALEALAASYVAMGNLNEIAVQLLGRSDVIREQTGTRLNYTQEARHDEIVRIAAERLGAERFTQLRVAGRSLSLVDLNSLVYNPISDKGRGQNGT